MLKTRGKGLFFYEIGAFIGLPSKNTQIGFRPLLQTRAPMGGYGSLGLFLLEGRRFKRARLLWIRFPRLSTPQSWMRESMNSVQPFLLLMIEILHGFIYQKMPTPSELW